MSSIHELQQQIGLKIPEDLLSESLLTRLFDPSTRTQGLEGYDEDITKGGFENPIPSVYAKATPGPSPGLGTGLFASRDVRAGETVVFIQRPFVAVLDTPRLESMCSGCLGLHVDRRESVELKACTGCRVVRYCDKTCQTKDWKLAHSLECRIFKKLKPRVLPNNARAILRMVLLSERGKYPEEEMEIFRKLESHMREVHTEKGEQWERISLTAKAVENYSGCAMDEDLVAEYAAKLEVNSFNFHSIMGDRLGIYMHPYAALINHSCDYNSVVGFDGEKLYVKALHPIRKGEQIFISYIDVTNPYKVRQRELSERYFFTCRCSKCKQSTNGREDIFPGESYNPDQLKLLEDQGFRTVETITAMEGRSRDAIGTLQEAMTALHRTHTWPLTRQPLAAMRDELITSLLSQGLLHTALTQALIRYRLIDPILYPDIRHPVRQLHAWTVAMIAINLSAPQPLEPHDPVMLERSACGMIAHCVLYQLMGGLSDSCIVPSMKKVIRRAFKDGLEGGFRPSYASLLEGMRNVWKDVDGVITHTLKREREGLR